MALTPDQTPIVAELRALMSDDLDISDEELWALYVANGQSINATLATVWDRTAVMYAGLVTIKEGSSSRDFSALYTRAQEIAADYRGRANADAGLGAERRTRTRAIVRP